MLLEMHKVFAWCLQQDLFCCIFYSKLQTDLIEPNATLNFGRCCVFVSVLLLLDPRAFFRRWQWFLFLLLLWSAFVVGNHCRFDVVVTNRSWNTIWNVMENTYAVYYVLPSEYRGRVHNRTKNAVRQCSAFYLQKRRLSGEQNPSVSSVLQ